MEYNKRDNIKYITILLVTSRFFIRIHIFIWTSIYLYPFHYFSLFIKMYLKFWTEWNAYIFYTVDIPSVDRILNYALYSIYDMIRREFGSFFEMIICNAHPIPSKKNMTPLPWIWASKFNPPIFHLPSLLLTFFSSLFSH